MDFDIQDLINKIKDKPKIFKPQINLKQTRVFRKIYNRNRNIQKSLEKYKFSYNKYKSEKLINPH